MSSITTPSSARQRGRDLEQRQDHRLVGAEQVAAGDPEEEAVADLTGRAGDCDTYGFLHGARS